MSFNHICQLEAKQILLDEMEGGREGEEGERNRGERRGEKTGEKSVERGQRKETEWGKGKKKE